MKSYRICILIISLLLALAQATFAQDESITFCGKLSYIDSNLGNKLSVFNSYTDFQQATLAKENEIFVISITYKQNGIFKFDKKIVTQDELNALCAEIFRNNN